MKTEGFFDRHPVFALDQAARAFAHQDHRATLERLRYHVSTGRLKAVARGLYARVPASVAAARFQPDPFLVAAAARSDGVFSHHSALELLGAAHSQWNVVTVFTGRRRRALRLGGTRIEFRPHPAALARVRQHMLGVRRVDRAGETLQVTGPERTLVDGFRSPALVGGVNEFVASAAGLPVLDLVLLRRVLSAYAEKGLYAATGWFLERYQRTFSVPESVLRQLERHRPRSPLYLLRGRRSGTLARRWNLILPEGAASQEPDER